MAIVILLAFAPMAPGQVLKILRDFPHGVDTLAFSADGKLLATGTRPSKGGKDAVTLWDVATGKELCRLDDHYPLGCSSLGFAPDGKTLVTNGGPGETILLWDVATRKARLTLKVPRGVGGLIAISPDSRTLAANGHGPPIRLYDMATGKEKLTFEGGFKPISLVYSPDGTMLAGSSYGGMVFLWDTATGKQRVSLHNHKRTVNSVAFSPDNKTLYSLGEDERLVHWDTATGKERKTLDLGERATSLGAMSPDGKTLAVLGGNHLRLFDLNQERFWPSVDWDYQRGRQRCIAFSPDGKGLATGSGGNPATNTVYLWDVPQPKQSRD